MYAFQPKREMGKPNDQSVFRVEYKCFFEPILKPDFWRSIP